MLNDIEDGLKPENIVTEANINTIRRWMKEYKDKLQQAAGGLRALLFKLFGSTINELVLSGIKRITTLERILKAFPPVKSSHIILGQTNLWLSLGWTTILL